VKPDVAIGVIGAGGIARSVHLPSLAAIGEAKLRAICDIVPGKADEAAQAFNIPRAYLSYYDMLARETLDAVYVLVQPDLLFRVAADCLLAGKHVFMEKPMGITLFQAATLRDLQRQSGMVLQVGFNRRCIPLVAEVIRKMRELTPITHVEGRFFKNSSPAFYGGCASSFVCDVIHVIDLVRHIASGDDMPRVDAAPYRAVPVVRAATTEVVNADTGIAEAWYSSFVFENGVSAAVRANYRTGGRVHQFELHGPGASAYIDLGFGGAGCSAKILRATGGAGQSLASAGSFNGVATVTGDHDMLDFDGIKLAGSDTYEVYYGYYDEDKRFVQAALAGRATTDDAAEAYASMALAEQLLQARSGAD
jgi:predicted dehydrogenase